jgi:hypothetical protein
MNHKRGRRARSGVLIAVAIGALAIFVLPGLAGAKGGHHRSHDTTGTIASFDKAGRQLVIELTGGTTYSGLVDRRTKIRCEDEHSTDLTRRGREAEPGDDHGGHGQEAGDDNGGRSGSSGHDDNGSGANCTVADLIPGAAVEKAELELEHGVATFDEVELVPTN